MFILVLEIEKLSITINQCLLNNNISCFDNHTDNGKEVEDIIKEKFLESPVTISHQQMLYSQPLPAVSAWMFLDPEDAARVLPPCSPLSVTIAILMSVCFSATQPIGTAATCTVPRGEYECHLALAASCYPVIFAVHEYFLQRSSYWFQAPVCLKWMLIMLGMVYLRYDRCMGPRRKSCVNITGNCLGRCDCLFFFFFYLLCLLSLYSLIKLRRQDCYTETVYGDVVPF